MVALWAPVHLLYKVHYQYPSRSFILHPGCPNRSLLLGLAASRPQPLPDLGFVSISWSHRHCIHNGTFWGRNTSSVKERQVPDRTTARTREREIHVPFRETEGGSESFVLVTVWLSYDSKSGSQGFTHI